MSRVCVIVLAGLPASGKTTFCQELLTLSQLPFNVMHVCFDDLFPFEFDPISHEDTEPIFSYKAERSKILDIIQSILNTLRSENINQLPNEKYKIPTSFNNTTDYVILFDDNNYYTSMRYKIYQMCQRNKVYYGQIYFPIQLAQSIQRNAYRGTKAQVPESIIKQMALRFEVPNSAENYWERDTFKFDNGKNVSTQTSAFLNLIDNIFLRPLKSNSSFEKQHICSPVHNLDLLLRRRIKEILIESKGSEGVKKSAAERLNIKRKEILCNYRKYPEEDTLTFLEMLNGD